MCVPFFFLFRFVPVCGHFELVLAFSKKRNESIFVLETSNTDYDFEAFEERISHKSWCMAMQLNAQQQRHPNGFGLLESITLNIVFVFFFFALFFDAKKKFVFIIKEDEQCFVSDKL